MTVRTHTLSVDELGGLDEVVRSFPSLLDSLRRSYAELEERAAHVEDELCRANHELESRLHEIDGLRRHLEAVLQSLPCGVIVRDADGRIVKANGAALSMLGLPAEELESRSDHPLLERPEADGEAHELVLADGRRLVLASSCADVRRQDGTLDGSVEILDDRTERTEMVERLHAADKMAALGTMAAGVAHEIRNPLNAVKGFADLLQRRPHEDPETIRWSRLIVEAAAEADAIIESMLSLGSPQRLRLEPIDGAELLEHAARLACASSTESAVDLSTRTSAPAFRGDRIKLRQAIRNLVANAIHAQGDDARVELALAQEGDEIVVRVADAGPGVAPASRRRIFDPFYTDHADGTGLGLPLVAAIARIHGGCVEVSPEPSSMGGAEFLIRFPFQPADGPAPHPQTPPQP